LSYGCSSRGGRYSRARAPRQGAKCRAGRYDPSLSNSRTTASPITEVETLAQPGAITSAVRRPEARTLVQARSMISASSSMPKE